LNASGTSNWSFNLNSASLANGAHSLIAKVNNTPESRHQLPRGVTSTTAPRPPTALVCFPSVRLQLRSSPLLPNPSSARQRYSAGSVLCLLGGSYNLSSSFTSHSGSPSAWIVYKTTIPPPSTSSIPAPPMPLHLPHHNGGSFPSGALLTSNSAAFNLNGQGNSGDAFWCGGTLTSASSPTLARYRRLRRRTRDCDYLTADHNLVYHNGYLPSSTSVLSVRLDQRHLLQLQPMVRQLPGFQTSSPTILSS